MSFLVHIKDEPTYFEAEGDGAKEEGEEGLVLGMSVGVFCAHLTSYLYRAIGKRCRAVWTSWWVVR